MIHELKVWPDFYQALRAGVQTFELRRNDRDFRVGHSLLLREWEPGKEDYTGALPLRFGVINIMHGPQFGLDAGWCILSIVPATPDWSPA